LKGWAVLAVALAACAAPREEAPPAGEAGATPVTVAPDAPDTTGVRGTLQWSDLGIRMVGQGRTAGLQIDVTTIADEAMELAVDDAREYFRDVRKKIPQAVPAREIDELLPFLVGYTGFEKEISFDPTRLEIRSEGSTYYPRYVVPVSPTFDRRVAELYRTVYAIYLFDDEVDLKATLEFRYDDLSSGTAWRQVVDRIQRAKTRLEGAGVRPAPGG
jgi:hypothetical protein